jgi:phage-related protein
MDEQLSVSIGARISDFTRKMKQVSQSIKSLPNKVTTKINVKVDEFHSKMGKISNAMNSVATVSAGMFKGGLLTTLPMLSPLIASLAGGLGGLATSFAAAGTGAIAFGAVATSALNDVFAANKNIKALREELANTKDLEKRAEILKQIEQATAGLSESQQKGLKALQSFSSFWGKFAKQFEKPVMDIFVRSLGQLQGLIKDLQPAFQGAVGAVDTLSKSFGGAIKTKEFQEFITFLNTNVGPAMVAMGKSFGNVMQGIMNLMTAFAPLSQDMQGGLVGLTEKFAKWSAGLAESKAFQNFINYVKENGPKVIALVGNITDFLVQLGVGMAPLGAKILTMVNAFLSWSSEMMKAHPLVGKIIAVLVSLGGMLMATIPVILLLKTTFGGMATFIWTKTAMMRAKFVTGFTMMMKSLGTFIAKMATTVAKFAAQSAVFIAKMVATSAKFVAKWALMGAKSLLHAAKVAASWVIAMGPVAWVIATVIGLVALIIANWDKIKAWTIKTWDKVWSWIKEICGKIAAGVLKYVTKAYKSVKDKFSDIVSAVREKMSEAWNKVKEIGGNIVDFFGGIDLYESGKAIIQSAIDGISAMKNKILGKVENIVGAVRDFWPFSPAKRGPLSDIHKMDFAGPITTSVERAKRPIERATKKLAESAKPKIGKVDYGARMKASIRDATNRVQSSVNHTVSAPKANNGNVNLQGMFTGANFYVNDEQDIEQIGQQIGDQLAQRMLINGVR